MLCQIGIKVVMEVSYMEKKIAVLFDRQENLTDIFHMEKVIIYEKEETWKQVNKITDGIYCNTSEEDIRTFLKSFIKKLEDCKIIVGSLIIGLPFYILDKNQFIICEAETFSEQLLEQITADLFLDLEEETEEKKAFEAEKRKVSTVPVPIDEEGNYYLDYVVIQKYYPEITSKKALLPFFSQQLFQSITIKCSHIMPWLEHFILEHNLQMRSKRDNGIYMVVVEHSSC